jgi:hypothetical protein
MKPEGLRRRPRGLANVTCGAFSYAPAELSWVIVDHFFLSW